MGNVYERSSFFLTFGPVLSCAHRGPHMVIPGLGGNAMRRLLILAALPIAAFGCTAEAPGADTRQSPTSVIVGGQEGCQEGNRLLSDINNIRIEDDQALLRLQSLARVTASAENEIRASAEVMAQKWGSW